MNAEEYVDPFLGVDEPGNCLCGPFLPHGLVRFGPDTLPPQSTSGYQSGHPVIGFSHTHVSGTGGGSRYGNILVTPFLGAPRLHGHAYEPSEENAAPGFYRVTLNPSGIVAELSATPRCGVHRYRFPSSSEGNLLIDAGAVIQTWHNKPGSLTGGCIGGFVEFVSDREVVGRGDFQGGWGHQYPYSVFFAACWDIPTRKSLVGNFQGLQAGQCAQGPHSKAVCHFAPGSEVNLVVGISFVSIAKARESVQREAHGRSFDQLHAKAQATWSEELSHLRVDGGSRRERTLFHTSHYRLRCMPGDLGVDDEFDRWISGRRHFNDYYALWDSVRNANSLLTLMDPSFHADSLNCLLDIAEHTGWLPDAWIAGHSAQIQGGSSADILFCEAASKGLEGVDYEKALAFMRKNNEEVSPDPWMHGRHLADYQKLGYVSTRVEMSCVSRHLEYAYQDWCIGSLAAHLGHAQIAETYFAGSQKVWNLWRDDLRCFAPRSVDGRWVEPFDPTYHIERRSFDPFFYEGNSRQWSINVQHDFEGLVRRHGGREQFVMHLDSMFSSGEFGLKETMMHAPYLYLYAGRPDLTARRVNEWLGVYDTGRRGLPDNEDMGCHSAFIILGSLGLYPLMGQSLYWLSPPVFPFAELRLGESGQTLRIERCGEEDGQCVEAAWLNGRPLERAWLTHEEIAHGAVLQFKMTKKDTAWGRKQLPTSPLGSASSLQIAK